MNKSMLAACVLTTSLGTAHAASVCNSEIEKTKDEWQSIRLEPGSKPSSISKGVPSHHEHVQAAVDSMRIHLKFAEDLCKQGMIMNRSSTRTPFALSCIRRKFSIQRHTVISSKNDNESADPPRHSSSYKAPAMYICGHFVERAYHAALEYRPDTHQHSIAKLILAI